jgi:valyl-tRNA synthetase
VDFDAERARIGKELVRVDETLRFLRGKLERPEFVERAPAEVVARERQRLDEQEQLRAKLGASLAALAEGAR